MIERPGLLSPLSSFGGVRIEQVLPGTVIKQGDVEHTVTDDWSVTKGGTIYMTEKNFEAVKARCK